MIFESILSNKKKIFFSLFTLSILTLSIFLFLEKGVKVRQLFQKKASISKSQPTIYSSSRPISSLSNIIFILTDDQAPGLTEGEERNSQIHLPPSYSTGFLKELAQNSTVFNNFYAVFPACAPNRSSLFTGKLIHSHGVFHNDRTLADSNTTLFEILRDLNGINNGYDTAVFGKCHLYPNDPLAEGLGFADERDIIWASQNTGPDGRNVTGGITSWYDYALWKNGKLEIKQDNKQDKYLTLEITNRAKDYIVRKAGEQKASPSARKPFFVMLSHFAPHSPHIVPKEEDRSSMNLGTQVSAESVTLPSSISDDLSTKPVQQRNSISHKTFQNYPSSYPSRETYLKTMLANYFEQIKTIDWSIGQILDAVKSSGIEENTIIIFSSDNGLQFGQHQMFQKGSSFYEELVNVPLMFSGPGIQKRKTDVLLSAIDFSPTILDLIGVNPTPLGGLQSYWGMQGKSFKETLINSNDTISRTSIPFESYFEREFNINGKPEIPFPARGIRTSDYKFIHYMPNFSNGEWIKYQGNSQSIDWMVSPIPNPPPDLSLFQYTQDSYELYNLTTDPQEMYNLLYPNNVNNILNRNCVNILSPNANLEALDCLLKENNPYQNIIKNLRRELAEWQTSTEDNFSQDYTIKNLVLSPSENSLTLTYNTDKQTYTEILYRPKKSQASWTSHEDFNLTTNHNVIINSLQPLAYEFKIYTIGQNGQGRVKNTEINLSTSPTPTVKSFRGNQPDIMQPYCSHVSSSQTIVYPNQKLIITSYNVKNATKISSGMHPKNSPKCVRDGKPAYSFGTISATYSSNPLNYQQTITIPNDASPDNPTLYTIFANPAANFRYGIDRTTHPYSWISTSNLASKTDQFWCVAGKPPPTEKTGPITDSQTGLLYYKLNNNGGILCNGDECDKIAVREAAEILSNDGSCTAEICVCPLGKTCTSQCTLIP